MVRWLIFSFLLILFSCETKQKEPIKKILYLTTSANDVYAFDIANKKLIWHQPSFNSIRNDEVSFFTLDDKWMTKSYLDGTIIRFDKRNGNEIWRMQDEEDVSHSYYGYDFDNVSFLLFSQYPIVYNGNVLFGNSHGEIKSVNIKTKKTNWVYIQNNIIYSSPKLHKGLLYVNFNGGMCVLDVKTGKEKYRVVFDQGATNELVINEEKVYLLTQKNDLMCYNLDLSLKWIFKTEKGSQSNTHNLLIDDENVYFGGGILYAVDKKEGKLSWQIQLDEKDATLLSVENTDDGILVMTKKKIQRIEKSGKIVMSTSLKNEAMGSLYRCNDAYYFCTMKGDVCTVDKELNWGGVFYSGINTKSNRELHSSFFGSD